MNNKEIWEKCIAFHGHVCPGLSIGYKAALYAMELLDITFSSDEQVVCVSENDACGVDAIQVVLGCSVGKGNLLFHMRGKQAFSFFNHTTGKAVRLSLKKRANNMSREQSVEYYQDCEPKEMFRVMKTRIELPERARIFNSVECSCCGEATAENMVKLHAGKLLCLDCYPEYDRFTV